MPEGPKGSCQRVAGVLALVLLGMTLTGCGTAMRSVRLDTGEGKPLVHRPRRGPEPVKLTEGEFRKALVELARDIRPSASPLMEARRLMQGTARQEEVDLEWTGRSLVPASKNTQAPRLAETPDEVTRAYGHWCEHKGQPADCLGLLKEGSSLDADGRYTLAFAIALDAVWDETKQALGEMVDAQAVRATVYTAAAMYLMLWVLPEPVSKGLAATLTAALMAYLGVDTVWGLISGWVRLVREVDEAQGFAGLREAGERYGKVMGRNSARIFVMLTTAAIGNTAGLVMKGPGLPGAARASMVAEEQAGFRWVALGEVRTVAVSAEGTFTLVLAPGAVAMTAQGAGGGTNSTTTRERGGITYRFNTGHAFNRPHKIGRDLRGTSLCPEDVENAIMEDLHIHRVSGGTLPTVQNGSIPNPYMGRVRIGLYSIEYSAVQAANGTVFVGTYYLLP